MLTFFLDEMHQYREVEHAFINTLVRGDVSSLTWFESPNQFFEDVKRKTQTDLELCHVYYSAVNFRDVMLAYGRLPPDAIPGQVRRRFGQVNYMRIIALFSSPIVNVFLEWNMLDVSVTALV